MLWDIGNAVQYETAKRQAGHGSSALTNIVQPVEVHERGLCPVLDVHHSPASDSDSITQGGACMHACAANGYQQLPQGQGACSPVDDIHRRDGSLRHDSAHLELVAVRYQTA